MQETTECLITISLNELEFQALCKQLSTAASSAVFQFPENRFYSETTVKDEFLKRMTSDPQFASEWRKNRDGVIAKKAEAFARDQQPVIRDLQASGVKVRSIWDLVNSSIPYPKALPVLIQHLRESHSTDVREAIARALAVRDASFAWPILVDEYRRENAVLPSGRPNGAKDGLAVALAATVTSRTLDDLIELAADKSHGSSRMLFARAFKRFRSEKARRAAQTLSSEAESSSLRGHESTTVDHNSRLHGM